MYGKFFASAFTGSMMASGAEVFAVWAYVIANGVKGHVELNPEYLAAVIGSTPDRMRAAIDKLCAPDPRSRSKENDGRRLIRDGEFQYHVTNLEHYRKILSEDDRRVYNREKKRESRARLKAVKRSVIDSQRQSSESAQARSKKQKQEEEELSPAAQAPLLPPAEEEDKAVPNCPYGKIRSLYNETLPELERAKLTTAARKEAMFKRWRWVFANPLEDGTPRATDLQSGIEWVRGFFARARLNDFLMGRGERTGPHAGWRCNFDFLLSDRGLHHVIEKTEITPRPWDGAH